MIVDTMLKQSPYRNNLNSKGCLLGDAVTEAVRYHCESCPPFAKWYYDQGYTSDTPIDDLSILPPLPASIFKSIDLRSVDNEQIVRFLHSSATTNQKPSRIAIDAITRNRQMHSLALIMTDLIGSKRRPFLVFDVFPSVTSVASVLPARIAGLRGYLSMASEVHYILDDTPNGPLLNVDRLVKILSGYIEDQTPVCLIGFTYLIYFNIVQPLLSSGLQISLPPNSMLIHFGGWKRLREKAVGRKLLNADVAHVFLGENLRIRDIYGFTEQLGIIYPDDGEGLRVTPTWAEVFTRDPFTLKILPDGEEGLLQFVTPLPHSYPGITLLVEDIGRIVSRDGLTLGRRGTLFEVLGRAGDSEVRGCGDVLST